MERQTHDIGMVVDRSIESLPGWETNRPLRFGRRGDVPTPCPPVQKAEWGGQKPSTPATTRLG
jgi:hypothetical protein